MTSSTVLRSVAAVHKDAEVHAVTLCDRIDLRPRHSAVIAAFTDIKPVQDTEVITLGKLYVNRPVELERVIVARTLTMWLAADGSVAVQIASPSSESLALHAGLEVGKLPSVSVVPPAQLHRHAVAATPSTPTEIAAAHAEVIAPLPRAFLDSAFTGKQQSAIQDLCAKYLPVDRPPYHPNPRTSEAIDKRVNEMLEWGIIGERPGSWGSPCTIVAKSNGSSRFCVDYRHTLNRHIIP